LAIFQNVSLFLLAELAFFSGCVLVACRGYHRSGGGLFEGKQRIEGIVGVLKVLEEIIDGVLMDSMLMDLRLGHVVDRWGPLKCSSTGG
jgi:hypothetical protein